MAEATQPQRIALASVLVATDFSPASRAALLYALSIVRRYGAALYLAHIVRPDTFHRADSDSARAALAEAWREGQRLTTDLLVSGQLRGIPHKLLVAQGDLWEGLAPMLRQNHIDLLVVGTRGRSGLAKMLLGSVAELVFRQAPCPVLTVGPRSNTESSTPDAGLRRILYATDFTPQSLHALDHSLSLAQHYQAHLILLHVTPEPAPHGEPTLQNAQDRLRQLIPSDVGLETQPDFVLASGQPAARILQVAAERSPDLIVLGVTHPQTGAFAGRRWTVASEVTANAACPVLTVRAPGV